MMMLINLFLKILESKEKIGILVLFLPLIKRF